MLALLGGGLLVLAFPGYDVWPLAPLAVALLALATCGVRARAGFGLGMLFGLLFFLWSLSWSGIYVGQLPWFALAALQALFVGLLGAATAFLQGVGGRPRVRPLVVALAWVAQEALRDRVPYGGFPWVRLAFSQADSPLGRLAALGGAPFVTFAVALAGGLLAAAVWHGARWFQARRAEHASSVPHGVRVALAAGVAALAVGAAGVAVPVPTDGQPAQVMGVQGNVANPGLDFNAERRQVLDNHVQATIDAAGQIGSSRSQPDLVAWPENSSDIDPTRNTDAAAQIGRAVTAVRAPILVGTLLLQPYPYISNVSLLYEPGQGITQTYVKQHPVPFAEYIPNRSFFRMFSDEVDLVRNDFAAGSGPVIFTVPAASGGQILAGPSICFEVAYDDLVRANVELGANLLVVQTNNATFGYTDESVQQLAISRIRAIEHGRSVVHVSTVGVSALITPDGTLHQATSLFTRAVLSGELPLRTARTVATMVGPWPEYVACAGLALLLALAVRSRFSARRGLSDEPVATADVSSTLPTPTKEPLT